MSDLLEFNKINIQLWICEYLSEITGDPIDSIALEDTLFKFDLDSIDSINMAIRMENVFKVEIPMETFLDGLTTIEEAVNNFSTVK